VVAGISDQECQTHQPQLFSVSDFVLFFFFFLIPVAPSQVKGSTHAGCERRWSNRDLTTGELTAQMRGRGDALQMA
jgi:hypothetical protein